MTKTLRWDLGRYRPFLRMQAERFRLDPRLGLDHSDLAGEALVLALKEIDHCRAETEAELLKWLQHVLTNRALDLIKAGRAAIRDIRRQQSLEATVEESFVRLDAFLVSREPSPSHEAERKEVLLSVARALDSLEEGQRQAVLRRHMLGQPVAEIAGEMGRNEKAVAGRIPRRSSGRPSCYTATLLPWGLPARLVAGWPAYAIVPIVAGSPTFGRAPFLEKVRRIQ